LGLGLGWEGGEGEGQGQGRRTREAKDHRGHENLRWGEFTRDVRESAGRVGMRLRADTGGLSEKGREPVVAPGIQVEQA
jgi:hypothetical protein